MRMKIFIYDSRTLFFSTTPTLPDIVTTLPLLLLHDFCRGTIFVYRFTRFMGFYHVIPVPTLAHHTIRLPCSKTPHLPRSTRPLRCGFTVGKTMRRESDVFPTPDSVLSDLNLWSPTDGIRWCVVVMGEDSVVIRDSHRCSREPGWVFSFSFSFLFVC
jgi:hypothetical protein